MSVNPETIQIRAVGNQTVFDITTRDAEGHTVVLRTVRVPYAPVRISGGKTRHIIYDEDCNVRREVYRYLNFHMDGYSANTIKRIVTALRLFIAFLEINRLPDYMLPEEDYPYFEYFLRRSAPSASSIAGYLADIRGFLKYIKHDNDALLRSRMKTTFFPGADGIPRPTVVKEYLNTPSTAFAKDRVFPEHNTVAEFFKLFKVMRDAGDVAGCIMIFLMIMGRRIGEVLNLTVEDVSKNVDTETGEITNCLFYRHRRDTTPDASAKNRTHVTDQKYYSSRDYIEEYMHPFNCRYISPTIDKMIRDYVSVAHFAAARDHAKDYAKTVVDVVNPEKFREEWDMPANHWLFLNERGGRLTRAAWCKRLARYYELAGVSRGFGKSLNHAFRHGSAYIQKYLMQMNDTEIADMLGHFNLASTRIYSKADFSKLAKLQEKVLDFIMNNASLEGHENEE